MTVLEPSSQRTLRRLTNMAVKQTQPRNIKRHLITTKWFNSIKHSTNATVQSKRQWMLEYPPPWTINLQFTINCTSGSVSRCTEVAVTNGNQSRKVQWTSTKALWLPHRLVCALRFLQRTGRPFTPSVRPSRTLHQDRQRKVRLFPRLWSCISKLLLLTMMINITINRTRVHESTNTHYTVAHTQSGCSCVFQWHESINDCYVVWCVAQSRRGNIMTSPYNKLYAHLNLLTNCLASLFVPFTPLRSGGLTFAREFRSFHVSSTTGVQIRVVRWLTNQVAELRYYGIPYWNLTWYLVWSTRDWSRCTFALSNKK